MALQESEAEYWDKRYTAVFFFNAKIPYCLAQLKTFNRETFLSINSTNVLGHAVATFSHSEKPPENMKNVNRTVTKAFCVQYIGKK